jgi:hypothetical protein
VPELLQNAASGGVRERGKRGIKAGSEILNHMVQYAPPIGGMQGKGERALLEITFSEFGIVTAGLLGCLSILIAVGPTGSGADAHVMIATSNNRWRSP